jgi:DNA (cytosine-5)-methyltransferase 1
MKILNLYAGTGGNRRLWPSKHHIVAVEIERSIAEIYAKEFPSDEIVMCDAHQFLLDFYKEFDFIWTSPPCPTHSQVNTFLNPQGVIRYPDMALWQEIIFLKHFCKVPYCVENVKSYYEPLIPPQKAGRHYFWANFIIPSEGRQTADREVWPDKTWKNRREERAKAQ